MKVEWQYNIIFLIFVTKDFILKYVLRVFFWIFVTYNYALIVVFWNVKVFIRVCSNMGFGNMQILPQISVCNKKCKWRWKAEFTFSHKYIYLHTTHLIPLL